MLGCVVLVWLWAPDTLSARPFRVDPVRWRWGAAQQDVRGDGGRYPRAVDRGCVWAGTVGLVSREREGAGSTIVTAAGSSGNGFRFAPEIISHGVWLYHRFPLSFRDVQELMLERGVDVSDETMRACCDRFGQEYANQLRRSGRRLGDKWHLDEVVVSINGAQR